ncbi:uncharacterized protein PFL1_05819 [Pseudozyma flocculosa PF-1]|uniref:Related to Sorting nexin 9 n=2 Tax=Pseudozyma flocculosa TaxID=84751 RepID=A0A5C3F225_9BASI|nr:uncharacterized protein PFL1_05819 [Pseudozyma flocculosa PF-1]EPQ26497.1 hypothetical protein PFL1_05819 [Pseudozyma flocculosa PF-1]SPO38518.1 related to Sorting nexin 9 [Pseudozyma flocculosa]
MSGATPQADDSTSGRAPSPAPSSSSIASSRTGTMSRPAPPPKPSHLSCAFTGTVNSVALREYIQAQKTGGSFTSDNRSGTISQAFAGYGYGSIDHFVDAFESSDDEGSTAVPDAATLESGADTARPSMRKRTYTAPSVSRVFNPAAEDDAGDGTTKLVRREPIQIDGKGPSRVGNLRSMFEAPAEAPRITPQRTGTGTTFSRAKAKQVSEKTRMLQAQITGERGAWTFSPTTESPSHASQASEASQKYETAKQDQIERELKKLSLIEDDQEAQGTVKLSPSRRGSSPIAVKESSTARADMLASGPSSPTAHDRDDSTATIRPRDISPQLNSTRRMPSTARTPSSSRRSRLSSVFSASSAGAQTSSPLAAGTPSPDAKSTAGSEFAETDAGRNERSREPSMLIDHQNVKTSAHMRAHDGSSFDFDWVNRARYPNPGTPERGTPPPPTPAAAKSDSAAADAVAVPGGSPDPSSRKSSSFQGKAVAPVAVRAGPPPQRPDSIVLSLESQAEEPLATVKPTFEVVPEEVAMLEEAVDATQPEQREAPDAAAQPAPVVRPPQPGIGREARALYDFLGEASFNELSLRAGQSFEILNEELAGGWSLGVVWDDEGLPRRGLIPRGWYCYIQDFTMSPPAAQGIEPPPTPSPFPDDEEESGSGAPPGLLGLGSPALPRSTTDAQDLDAAAAKASPLGGRAMSRIGSLNAASNPLAGISPAKANGGTWKQSTSPVSLKGAQALESLAALAADHGISASSVEAGEGPPGGTMPTPKLVVPEQDVHLEAPHSDDGSTVVIDEGPAQPWAPALEAQHPTRSTPSRPEAPRVVSPVKAEAVSSTAMFAWRTSILRGKTLNRFASFVTSGAEDYILSNDGGSVGSDRSREALRPANSFSSFGTLRSDRAKDASATPFDGPDHARSREPSATSTSTASTSSTRPTEDADQHYVVAGPAGPKWKAKTPPFLVQVHSPEKRTKMSGMHEYTVFCVTSTFPAHSSVAEAGGADAAAADASASWDSGDGDGEQDAVRMPFDPLAAPDPPGPSLTVFRRFTQFAWLYQTLTKHFPALVIPPLPEKQYSGRFAAEFIETRRADLELWLGRIVRHPVLRYTEAVLFFLSCDDELEWKRKAGRLLKGEGWEGGASGSTGNAKIKANMFARTWHPSFNFDAAEAALEGEAVDAHLRAMERTMNGVGGPNVGRQGVLGAWKGLREGAVSTSACYRDLSYSMLRLITGVGVVDASGALNGGDAALHGHGMGGGGGGVGGSGSGSDYAHYLHGPPMGNLGKRSESGATNEHGVWCWREGCHECTNLTYVLQNTAEAMQDVADLFEHHARDTLLRQHERLKDVSRPHTAHQALLEVHRATLAKYREATGEPDPLDPDSSHIGADGDGDGGGKAATTALTAQESERIASRCETVLNVTLAEMDRVHDERVEDLHSIGKRFLDSQIDVYEDILATLKSARAHYDPEYYDCERGTHILPSRFQADLSKPRRADGALPMPSAALGGMGGLGKVGMLLSTAAGMTRPVSSGFLNGAGAVTVAEMMERSTSNASSSATGGGGGGGSFFLFPNAYSPSAAAEARTGSMTATSTLKASQQQQQQQQSGSGGGGGGGTTGDGGGGGGNRVSYFSHWR